MSTKKSKKSFYLEHAPFLGLLILFCGFSLYAVVSFFHSTNTYLDSMYVSVVGNEGQYENTPEPLVVTDSDNSIVEIFSDLDVSNIHAVKIMQKYAKISFYDAAYHATAIENNGTFITADKKYYEKTKSTRHIKLLKDYKS